MSIDRDATLKSAEKLLRQGKLEAAIAEYVRLIAAQPGDWSSINALGDLYVRAGQIDRAVSQFARVADHLVRERSLPKASAVYKKILRISPGDPRGTRGLALVSERQADAAPGKKAAKVAADDPDARMLAAREAQDAADTSRACTLLIEAADLYEARGRPSDALAAVAEASSVDPSNLGYRERLLRMLIAQGEIMQARYVARVGPELVMVADAFERIGRRVEALDTIAEAAASEPADASLRERVLRQLVDSGEIERARRIAQSSSDLLVVAEALNASGRGAEVLDVLGEAVERDPHNGALREQLITTCLAASDLERARGAARTSRDWLLLAAAFRKESRSAEALAAMREASQRDPHDATLHAAFVRACIESGDLLQARRAARTKREIVEVADALESRGEGEAARQMRADALRRDPDDPELRVRLIRDYMRTGERDRAHALLTLDVAGDDVELILLLARLEFGIGRLDEGRRVLGHLVAVHGDRRGDVLALGRELADADEMEAAFACAEVCAESAGLAADWNGALAALQDFVTRAPSHLPALMRLVEICVDGNLDSMLPAAQEQLADAYLAAGQGGEARVIAEDLVLRAPWERGYVERCRRALTLCGDADPDRTLAELLSGDPALTIEDL